MMAKGVLKEKKAAHAKGQFVASVTHELRAPVGSMRLMADALEGGKLTTEKEGEFHRLMARESGRLSVLIENVMDLARVEDGRRAIHKEVFSLPDLVAEVCEMMALPALEKEVVFKQDGRELEVEADALVIRQVLVNLIDNAIKFSPAKGEVLIAWSGDWWLSVSDQGPGIPEEDRERIFERFYRREDELRRKTQGVGIGLSLVKELVTLHDGAVKVEQDEGAVFRVEFNGR
jgi:signal transduction histidine kinase